MLTLFLQRLVSRVGLLVLPGFFFMGATAAAAVSAEAVEDTVPKQPAPASAPVVFDEKSPYYFDGAISRQTLEKYLERSVTMGYFLVPGNPERYEFPYREDDIRLIRNIGAKFIGRAIYRWGEESRLNDPAFLAYAQNMVERVHAFDPEVIFQGCLFEQVSGDVNNLKIPAWVFTDFGLSVEDRTFSSEAITKRQGGAASRPGRRGGVPIINNLETQLWFYYLAVSYINIGCEAFHLGQVRLIGAEDRDLKIYSEFLAKVRAYAKIHARRHWILLDGHVPAGGMVRQGVSLLDFNSFPMRIKAVPEKPYEGILEVGHLDAIFKRSKGCISPSGWRCESLPYLVEFDNFGRDRVTNVANTNSMFCWGWDEISWFALQPEEYRNHWLRYAQDWIKETDPNGHLQMPVTRMITCPNETLRTYFANTRSPDCPVGYSQEETIKEIWNSSPYVFVPQDYGLPLTNVADVAVDSRNNVFTIVRGETPILVFNPQGKFLYGWGKGLIAGPHGIYIDSHDNVFCVDTKGHVVSKFTTDGKLLMTLGLKGVPSDSGSVKGNFKTVKRGAGPFNVPTKVATSKSGDIFVSDGYGNARVHRFSAEGKLIKSWGEPGTGPGQFNLPHGIAVDDNDNVYVADRENERIQVFDIEGNLKSIWTNIYRPSAICVHRGKVYVTELGHRTYVDNVLFTPDGKGPWSRVRIFDTNGVEQANFGGPEGWKPGNFFAPHGICVDKEGAIYVAEVVWPANESAPPKDLHPALQKFRPQHARPFDDIEILRDIEIGKVGARVLHADIARPKTPPAVPMPAVMWIHGGGWSSGSHHDLQQAVRLANHGYLVLSVEYRLVNEAIWPAQIEDCKLGVRWLREHAASYHVNPDRIGCWGASAGGHLAALMGVTGDKPDLEGNGGSVGFSSRVQAVVDFCGPTDFKGRSDVSRKMAGGTYEQKTDVFKQMSPLENANSKACPFLIVNGEKDTTVPLFHAQLMTDALKKANVPVQLIIVKNAGHGYTFVAPPGSQPAQPSPAEVDTAVLEFLDANLKK
ncbi:MAG TPA: alpha/beta hydrolase fold domain-containing protein [Candidatus Acidoferrum sp.]|jgi:acetyl esterase/lipase/outer membrane protein assembly factor BamB|nr:alpha/beta hydrolase fold domain-containing protein [Candidatus Acidoferrum sp.]